MAPALNNLLLARARQSQLTTLILKENIVAKLNIEDIPQPTEELTAEEARQVKGGKASGGTIKNNEGKLSPTSAASKPGESQAKHTPKLME